MCALFPLSSDIFGPSFFLLSYFLPDAFIIYLFYVLFSLCPLPSIFSCPPYPHVSSSACIPLVVPVDLLFLSVMISGGLDFSFTPGRWVSCFVVREKRSYTISSMLDHGKRITELRPHTAGLTRHGLKQTRLDHIFGRSPAQHEAVEG